MHNFETLRTGAKDWIAGEKSRIVRVGGILGFERLRFRQTAVAGTPFLVAASESTHLLTRQRTGLISVADFTNGDRAMVKWHEDEFFIKSPLIRSADREVSLRNLTVPQEELVHLFVASALAHAITQSSQA